MASGDPTPSEINTGTEQPQSREIAVIAAIGLVGATFGAVAGMVYGVSVQGDSSAALVSIASIGIGSLATLAGTAATRKPPPPPPGD